MDPNDLKTYSDKVRYWYRWYMYWAGPATRTEALSFVRTVIGF